MAAKSFSIHGKGLRIDTKEEIVPLIQQMRAIPGLEEIHLGGNTFGTEACIVLAEELKRIDTLKVCFWRHPHFGKINMATTTYH
jgi:Ran GTPase-activating protein 1